MAYLLEYAKTEVINEIGLIPPPNQTPEFYQKWKECTSFWMGLDELLKVTTIWKHVWLPNFRNMSSKPVMELAFELGSTNDSKSPF